MTTISPDDDECNQKVLSARDLIWLPTYATIPVSHCATPSDLLPFDLVMMGTIISITRMLRDETNREQARQSGREYREIELKNYEEFGERWKARRRGEHYLGPDGEDVFGDEVPTILHTFEGSKERVKPLRVKVAVRRAMAEGYKKGLRQARRHRPSSIMFEASPSLLLKAARLSDSASNRTALARSLRKLRTQGLLTFETQDTGIVVTVRGRWLERQYNRLPLPLPTRSKLGLQLLLWLQHAKPKPLGKDKRFVSIAHLMSTKLFGYRNRRRFREALSRATATINQYLRPLDRGGLWNDFKIKLPASYSFAIIDDKIRFATSEETIMKRKQRRSKIVRERLDEPKPEPATVIEAKPRTETVDKRPPIYRVPANRMDALEDYLQEAGFEPYQFEKFSRLREPVLIELRDRLTLRFLGHDGQMIEPRRTASQIDV